MNSPFDVFRKNYTVLRKAKGQYQDGFWQEGGITKVTIFASIQPEVNLAKELQEVSHKKSGDIAIFTNNELISLDKSQNPDIVLFNDNQYEVIEENLWQNDIISHYQFTAKLKNEPVEVPED